MEEKGCLSFLSRGLSSVLLRLWGMLYRLNRGYVLSKPGEGCILRLDFGKKFFERSVIYFSFVTPGGLVVLGKVLYLDRARRPTKARD